MADAVGNDLESMLGKRTRCVTAGFAKAGDITEQRQGDFDRFIAGANAHHAVGIARPSLQR